MKMRRAVAFILSLLLAVLPVTPVLADTLSIDSWSTGNALSATNLNSRMTSIITWSTRIANDNILSTAAIVGSKLDLTSGTGRISHSTSVTSDAPVFTSAQTWNNVATVFSMWRGTVTNTNSASSSRLLDLRVGSTIIASVSRVGQLMVSPQDYASGPTTLMEGVYFNIASATYTDNMTAASGTAPRFIAYAFQRPAVAAANSSVTTTDAATVFIASAPVAGDNMTLTNRWALWVDQGNAKIGGILAVNTATIASAGVGDLVLPNGSGDIRAVMADGTNTFSLMGLDSGNNLQFRVPDGTDTYRFSFAATEPLNLRAENGGAGLHFLSESSADQIAPGLNGAIVYTKDNGAGKTQLVVRFNTGAVQVLATEP